jgi:hypothetical protein
MTIPTRNLQESVAGIKVVRANDEEGPGVISKGLHTVFRDNDYETCGWIKPSAP